MNPKFFSSIAYLFGLAAILIYPISLFLLKADGNYIIRLSDNSTHVSLNLGYYGVCASKPYQDDLSNSSAMLCKSLFSLDEDDSKMEKLAEDLYQDMDLEAEAPADYSQSLAHLLGIAKTIRQQVAQGHDLVAAFVLLLLGCPASVIPVFFNSKQTRKRTALALMFTSLFLVFGLMAAGAAVLSTIRVQSLFKELQEWSDTSVSVGKTLRYLLIGGLACNIIFVLLVIVLTYVYYTAKGKRSVHHEAGYRIPSPPGGRKASPQSGRKAGPPRRAKGRKAGWFNRRR